MTLSIITAMSINRVIGINNRLPWYIPSDLRRFKELTIKREVVMGRKTYESLGRALPDRTNVILTRQKYFKAPGCEIINSLNLVTLAKGEAFIIGGAEIYQQTIELCNRMYITEIQKDFDGDTFFPEFDKDDWKETQREKHFYNDLEYHFVIYDK